ncbi:MAG: hypothetical protein EKK40_17980 [Bradyrhizobiaceae bacterium]|nr:MAG: hypothetical protein EKK40_17980 [Bradyrhizobiaceae bacterium]
MFCGLAVIASGSANAQAAFPAPLPGEAAPSQAPALTPFPPVGGGAAPMRAPAAFPSGGAAPMGGGFGPPPAAAQGGQDCMAEFAPLKQEAEKRGAFIKALGQRHGSPAEACKAIAAFGQAELKMIKFFETNARRCGIPPQVAQQASQGHKMTEQMQTKVCAAAQQPQGGPAPSLTEALGASVSVPEATPTKRSGGSTFDTLSGNVLAR